LAAVVLIVAYAQDTTPQVVQNAQDVELTKKVIPNLNFIKE